eukprot:gene15121-20348_t
MGDYFDNDDIDMDYDLEQQMLEEEADFAYQMDDDQNNDNTSPDQIPVLPPVSQSYKLIGNDNVIIDNIPIVSAGWSNDENVHKNKLNVSKNATDDLNLSYLKASSYSRSLMEVKKMTPQEIALELQEKRKFMLENLDHSMRDSFTHQWIDVVEDTNSFVTSIHEIPRIHENDMKKYIHSRPPMEDKQLSYMDCTLSNGSKCFLYKRVTPTLSFDSHNSSEISLLSKPIQQLMKESESIQINSIVSKQLTDTGELHSSIHAQNLMVTGGSLWVDKYAPKSFMELLSPEKTNREVLKSVKKWDTFVFKTPPVNTDENDKNNHYNNQNKDDTRPYTKVIMLCGPPGTGKTTMAHVIASHCGYRPIEINASDDRSPEILKERISQATQNTTLDDDKRPNCIILDEIDGIDGRNSLDAIISIIKEPLRNNMKITQQTSPQSSQNNKTISKKSSSSSFPLLRPLICICNDQYASSLRELRKYCDIFVCQKPHESRLVQRLKTICSLEKISLSQSYSSTIITELCRAAGFDIRSAINNLQFISLKASYQITSQQKQANNNNNNNNNVSNKIGSMLESMIMNGLKDNQIDANYVWKQIFLLQTNNNSVVSNVALSSYSLNNDNNEKKNDNNTVDLHRTHLLNEAMSYNDIWNNFMLNGNGNGSDGYQLMQYIPSIASTIYTIYHSKKNVIPTQNQNRKFTLEWPKKVS